MLADPHAAAVAKVALDQNPDSPHAGVTVIMALEDQGYRIVTTDQIRQVLADVERWRTEAQRKVTLRSEIEEALGLRDVDPDNQMDVALDTIKRLRGHGETAP